MLFGRVILSGASLFQAARANGGAGFHGNRGILVRNPRDHCQKRMPSHTATSIVAGYGNARDFGARGKQSRIFKQQQTRVPGLTNL